MMMMMMMMMMTTATELLRECDEVRDGVLASLGVSLEDKEGGSVVKLVGVGVMKGVVEEKMELRRIKQAQKEEKLAQQVGGG